MRKSGNYKAEFETRLKEIKRYVGDIELALENLNGDQLWRYLDGNSAYLRDAANKLTGTALEGALLNEIETELAEDES